MPNVRLILVAALHLVAVWYLMNSNLYPDRPLTSVKSGVIILIKQKTLERMTSIFAHDLSQNRISARTSKSARFTNIPTPVRSAQKTNIETANPELSTAKKTLNRDIKTIVQGLEREWTQEERNLQAAKPPNQLVREYWEKQNHPYKDKWEELASKIEKAGVARGPQEESYTLDDGSRITKINGICYKAPDPGRNYLGQPEVRRVFCPRN